MGRITIKMKTNKKMAMANDAELIRIAKKMKKFDELNSFLISCNVRRDSDIFGEKESRIPFLDFDEMILFLCECERPLRDKKRLVEMEYDREYGEDEEDED